MPFFCVLANFASISLGVDSSAFAKLSSTCPRVNSTTLLCDLARCEKRGFLGRRFYVLTYSPPSRSLFRSSITKLLKYLPKSNNIIDT